MKKVISTIVAVGFISSMLVNTAHAGRINPLWIPVAVLSTIAAVTIANAQPVVYERHITYEPRQRVIYEEPRQRVVYEEPRQRVVYEEPRHNHYRHARYYERDRAYEAPRYREYR